MIHVKAAHLTICSSKQHGMKTASAWSAPHNLRQAPASQAKAGITFPPCAIRVKAAHHTICFSSAYASAAYPLAPSSFPSALASL